MVIILDGLDTMTSTNDAGKSNVIAKFVEIGKNLDPRMAGELRRFAEIFEKFESANLVFILQGLLVNPKNRSSEWRDISGERHKTIEKAKESLAFYEKYVNGSGWEKVRIIKRRTIDVEVKP